MELGLQLTRSAANEDNNLSVPVVNNKNTEKLSCIFKKLILPCSVKLMEYSISSQTPEISLLTIKCLCITHVLRGEFNEELRVLGDFLPPNQTSWTWFLAFYLQTLPVSAAKCVSTSSSTGVRRIYPVLGVYPSTN